MKTPPASNSYIRELLCQIESITAEKDKIERAALAQTEAYANNIRSLTAEKEAAERSIGGLHEELAATYGKYSGKQYHENTCAISLAPAERPGPCNCAAPYADNNGLVRQLRRMGDFTEASMISLGWEAAKVIEAAESSLAQAREEITELKDMNAKWYKEGNEFKEAWRENRERAEAAEQREKGLREALEKIAEGYKPFNMSIISLQGKIAFDALERAALAERDAARDYKEAIEEALAVSMDATTSGDAKIDLHRLITWETQVALDPRVSKKAAAQLATAWQQGAEAMREAAAKELDHLCCSEGYSACNDRILSTQADIRALPVPERKEGPHG